MRRIVVVLGVAAVMAAIVVLMAGAALAQAETETWHYWGDESPFIWYNPCAGEEILFEGDSHQVSHVTLNKNGYHINLNTATIGITGTGLETGDKYRFINPGRYVQYQEIEDEFSGLFINNEGATQLLVSSGDSPNTLLHYIFKVTADTDGQPSLVIDKFTFRCIPKGEPQWPDEPIE